MTTRQNKRKQFADQLTKWFGQNETSRKLHRNNKEIEMRKRMQFRIARKGK